MSILRNLIGAVGLIGAAGAIALVAANGYATGATPPDSFATALVYSIIALTGLAGPAAARLLYRSSRMKPAGVLLGILSAAALAMNVPHLIAAATGEAARSLLTETASITSKSRSVNATATDELELQRIISERAALYFNGTSEEALAAARAAYLAAQAAHYSQCVGRQDPKCEELAAALATKQNAFLAAVRDRIATEQAEKLDAEAASLRARLGSAYIPSIAKQPVAPDGPRYAAKSPAPETATWNQIFAALAAQVAIAFSLILWDLPNQRTKSAAIRQAIGDVPVRPTRREQASEGDLTKFVHECLSPASGESVEVRALYVRFLDWCDEQRLSALPPRVFTQAFVKRCAEAQIEVRHRGSDIVCVDVKLAPAHLLH